MKSQIRTSDCEGWSYFLARRCNGRPEKNRISMKQIGCFVLRYLDTLRRNADARLIGGVAIVRNHFQMFSLYTFRWKSFYFLPWQQLTVLTFSCSQDCEWYLLFMEMLEFIALSPSVAGSPRFEARWDEPHLYLAIMAHCWSLIGWQAHLLFPIGQEYQTSILEYSRINHCFSVHCWSNLGMAPVSTLQTAWCDIWLVTTQCITVMWGISLLPMFAV